VTGERIEQLQRLHLVVENGQANRFVGAFRGEDVEHIAVDRNAAPELGVVALVLHFGKAL
jgi:hypothetical protein